MMNRENVENKEHKNDSIFKQLPEKDRVDFKSKLRNLDESFIDNVEKNDLKYNYVASQK